VFLLRLQSGVVAETHNAVAAGAVRSGGAILRAVKGIEMEPSTGNSPETNGPAERHTLRLLNMSLPVLADSSNARHGLQALGPVQYIYTYCCVLVLAAVPRLA
jgi:hypothetical protein